MLAIIVVLYRCGEAIRPFWNTLHQQTDAAFHLFAIDNPAHEPDPAASILEAAGDPRITLLRNPHNAGFARAVNQALRLAYAQGCDRFLLLNPDTAFGPTFLTDLTTAWHASGYPVIAPRVMQADAPDQAWYAGGHLDHGWIFSNRHDPYIPGQALRQVEFASGCCLGLTRPVLEQVGLLDESFFVYWEDTDLSLRLRAAGIPIAYLEHPHLLHEGGASSGGNRSPLATRLYYTAYAQLLRKHFGWRDAWRQATRIWRVERIRTGTPSGHGNQVLRALLRGLRAPLHPVPRL